MVLCEDCGRPVLSGASLAHYCSECAYRHAEMCSTCGEDAGNGAGGYSNCCGAPLAGPLGSGSPVELERLPLLRLGLIRGRHEMPVDEYLLADDVTDHVGYHAGVFEEARRLALEVAATRAVVHLYTTGLTVAAIGAFHGLMEGKVTVTLLSYDREGGSYVPIPVSWGGGKN